MFTFRFHQGSESRRSPQDQKMLRHHCILERTIDICEIRYVAGADAAYDQDTIYAAVVVMKFPGLEVVEKTCSVQEVSFPYIPGLLSFREGRRSWMRSATSPRFPISSS